MGGGGGRRAQEFERELNLVALQYVQVKKKYLGTGGGDWAAD